MRKTLKIVIALVTFLCAWGVSGVLAQSGTGRPFITKWQGTKGVRLKIPIVGTYKMVIKDESGNEKVNETVTVKDTSNPYLYVPATDGFYTFVPTEDGIYTVEAGPEGVRYMKIGKEWYNGGWNNQYWIPVGSNNALLEVVQFGTVAWESMEEMFEWCYNMTFAAGIDTPDLSKVTNMEEMFYDCYSFNQPIGNWDVSNVRNMERMFLGCSAFNQPLNEWRVDKVSSMRAMFYGCRSFNQPLDNWNVSNVTSMHYMFYDCSAFNQPLNDWDVSKVESMEAMFYGCRSFNQPLNNWDVSNVEHMSGYQKKDYIGMFEGCSSFNQPLGKWDVSKVTNMENMFKYCSSFNQPLDKWNVDSVTNMKNMFYGCSSFNQPLGSWKIKTAVGGLSKTAMSPSNYSATLAGWAAQNEIAKDVEFINGGSVSGLIYNNEGKVARKKLINKGWYFSGDIYQSSGIFIVPRSNLALNKECTLPLEKWGVEETEEVTLSTNREGIISYELTADKKGVHIKGLKEGWCELTATIAAKAGVHDAYTSTCDVDIHIEHIPIEHFTLTPASKTIKVGDGFKLTANFFPKNATKRVVKWVNFGSECATISNTGYVTAQKVGKYWIYAQMDYDEHEIRGRCEVTVVDEIAPVASITIPEKQTLMVGTTVPLIAVVKPDNAEQGLVWSSSDPEIAMVSEGFVWGKKKGTCTITVKSLDTNCSITKECKITVEVPSFTVTLTQPTNGKIAIEGHATESSITVEQGTILTVTVTPDEGYKLKTLKANHKDITTTLKFTVTATTTVTAVFEKQTFAVTPSVNNEAWGSIELTGASDLTAVAYDTELTVKVTENEGYRLKTLTAGDEDITTTRKFTVKAATEVKAVFEKETFAVTTSVNNEAWGSIKLTGASDLTAVPYRTELIVKVTENEGYRLKTLTAGNEDITETLEFVVKAATEVKAVFESKQKDNNRPGAVEDALLAGISVAPNPFAAQLRILNPEGVVARYEVVNAAGVVVRSGALSEKEVVVDTEALSAGVYFVRIEAQNGARKSLVISK